MTNEYGFEIPLVSEEECKLQERIEELEEQLETEKKLNEEIKVRFVKCNTCTDEMKSKCLMFSENLCEGDHCEELVDLIELMNKSDLQRENADLRARLYAIKLLTSELKKKSKFKAQLLTKAKELLKQWLKLYNTNTVKGIIADTEQFLNGDGCPDTLCEDCTKEDCTVRKLGLVEK